MSWRRWVSYATCAWSVAFGVPHLWWALGVSWGFPGGEPSYLFFMSSAWRYVYDWVVITCSVLGVFVPLALLKPPDKLVRRWVPHSLAYIACVLLTVCGGVGLILDRGRDHVWDPTFLLGGILFGAVALLVRTPRQVA